MFLPKMARSKNINMFLGPGVRKSDLYPPALKLNGFEAALPNSDVLPDVLLPAAPPNIAPELGLLSAEAAVPNIDETADGVLLLALPNMEVVAEAVVSVDDLAGK